MEEPASFEEWLGRIRAQDEQAAQVLFDRFARILIHRAREHIALGLQARLDPEDVVQSVLRTCCVRLREGQFQLVGWDDLWGLLTRITLHKCNKWREHHYAAKRDLQREQRAAGNDEPGYEPIARDPDPSEAQALQETLDRLLSRLSAAEQQIVQMKFEEPDVSREEIARRLGCSPAKVGRVLTFIRERLERLRQEA